MENSTFPPSASETSSKKRPAPRGTAAYVRKRGNTACQVCRARRTKCDRALPACSFCEKSGATCIRSPVDLSSFDPASLQILERIDDLSQQFRTWTAGQILQHTNRGQLSYASNDESDVFYCQQAELFPQTEEQALVPYGMRRQSLLTLMKESGEVSSSTFCVSSPLVLSFTDLEPQSAKRLVDDFFTHVHVKNPILDEQFTRQLVSHFVLNGADWSAQSCLALLICSLGRISSPLGPSPATSPGTLAYSDAQSYFLAAQKRLGSCLVVGGLVQAQCLFLAGVYLMNIFKPVEAWRMFSQALACCQTFSFLNEINPSEDNVNCSSPPDPAGMVAEQAVYWSAWKSELELRTALQPPDFGLRNAIEFPGFFPTPPAADVSETPQQLKAWTFYLTEISLRRQHLTLMADTREVVGLSSSFNVDLLVSILPNRLKQIDDWLLTVPQPIGLGTPVDDHDICTFVLRGQLLNLYEMLYCPFLNTYLGLMANSEDLSNADTQSKDRFRRTQLKKLAEKALWLHSERIQVNKSGFHHRHHGTWFMIRTCSRSATILLEVALKQQERDLSEDDLDLPDGWYDAVMDVIELHRYWRSEAPDASARVSVLEKMNSQMIRNRDSQLR